MKEDKKGKDKKETKPKKPKSKPKKKPAKKETVEESTALAVTLSNDKALGQIFVESGFFSDAKEQSQAVVKILAGREVGLQPIEAMTGIHIIKGKISFGANMMAAAVKKHPKYNYDVTKHTDKECIIDFYEGGKKAGTSSFSLDDAKRAGVMTTGGSWYKYPKAMLFARAMSAGVRYYCPDVFGHSPVYVPEEMGASVDEEGEPIDVTPKKTAEPLPERPPPSEDIQDADFEDQKEDPDDKVRDIPDDIVEEDMTPRDGLKAIMSYAWDQQIGDAVRPVIIKHYEPWETGEPDVWNIPEEDVIAIVEELTGITLKKSEKTKKCSGCDKVITEPEAEEQEKLCLVCYKKHQESDEDSE